VLAGLNSDQTFFSNTVLIFGDNLGDRRFVAVISSLSTFTQFFFSYSDLSRRLQKGVQLFDVRTYYFGFDPTTGQVERVRQAARYTGGYFTGLYPLSRNFRLEGTLGFISRNVDYTYLQETPEGPVIGVQPDVANAYPEVGLSVVGDTTEYQLWGPRSGYRFAVGFSYAPDFAKDESLPPGSPIGSTLTRRASVDLRHYIPISKRMLFALRAVGFQSVGNIPDICSFGGLSTLRGVNFQGIFGNSCAYANFEFRFPLIDVIALPWIGFRDIRGHVFFDVGGSRLKGGTFDFWNSEENRLTCDTNTIIGCTVASYGAGLDVTLLGLPVHFDWAKVTNLKTTIQDFRFFWYIGYVF
ncbi:MAG: BamA/TamA family outer membrane protein, partial [Thermoanaerobaculia bacterium]